MIGLPFIHTAAATTANEHTHRTYPACILLNKEALNIAPMSDASNRAAIANLVQGFAWMAFTRTNMGEQSMSKLDG
jgi:hypothetical protein